MNRLIVVLCLALICGCARAKEQPGNEQIKSEVTGTGAIKEEKAQTPEIKVEQPKAEEAGAKQPESGEIKTEPAGAGAATGEPSKSGETKTEPPKGEKMTVQNGRQVSFDYTLTVDGEIIDSSTGRGPLVYEHGDGKIIPGLARQLEGMGEGEEKEIVVVPEEAYGQVDPKATREVPKTSLPKDLEPKAGTMLMMRSESGQAFPVKIAEVKPESVMIDMNHPLAGKTLTFKVKIVSIK